MKIFSKVLVTLVLVCAIYFVSGARYALADGMEELDDIGCSGNTCQVCQCNYNKCANKPGNPQNCSDAFLYCINGDYNCGHS